MIYCNNLSMHLAPGRIVSKIIIYNLYVDPKNKIIEFPNKFQRILSTFEVNRNGLLF